MPATTNPDIDLFQSPPSVLIARAHHPPLNCLTLVAPKGRRRIEIKFIENVRLFHENQPPRPFTPSPPSPHLPEIQEAYHFQQKEEWNYEESTTPYHLSPVISLFLGVPAGHIDRHPNSPLGGLRNWPCLHVCHPKAPASHHQLRGTYLMWIVFRQLNSLTPQGKHLIQSCLNAPDETQPPQQTPIENNPPMPAPEQRYVSSLQYDNVLSVNKRFTLTATMKILMIAITLPTVGTRFHLDMVNPNKPTNLYDPDDSCFCILQVSYCI